MGVIRRQGKGVGGAKGKKKTGARSEGGSGGGRDNSLFSRERGKESEQPPIRPQSSGGGGSG